MTKAGNQLRLPVRINRNTPSPALQPLTDYFRGFEKVGAVRAVFGENTEAVLKKLKIGFVSNRRMYMGIRDDDGNIAVGTYHLRHSDLRTLYLDMVHELFHIKQRMEDGEYFHREFMKFMRDRSLYYASPIEVPAYKHTVREAERIGMTSEEIVEHLKMGPAPPKVFSRFLKEMELGRGEASTSRDQAKLPVRINRNPSIALHPFTDYFRGFEKMPAISELFGGRTKEVLRKLKVEFVDIPFGSIFPSEEDGHLVVSAAYVKKGAVSSIYLDVLVCLNLLKRASKGKASFSSEEQEFGESPVVLESYKAMVDEARRIGISGAKALERLQLPRFMMGPAGYTRFVRNLGLKSR